MRFGHIVLCSCKITTVLSTQSSFLIATKEPNTDTIFIMKNLVRSTHTGTIYGLLSSFKKILSAVQSKRELWNVWLRSNWKALSRLSRFVYHWYLLGTQQSPLKLSSMQQHTCLWNVTRKEQDGECCDRWRLFSLMGLHGLGYAWPLIVRGWYIGAIEIICWATCKQWGSDGSENAADNIKA